MGAFTQIRSRLNPYLKLNVYLNDVRTMPKWLYNSQLKKKKRNLAKILLQFFLFLFKVMLSLPLNDQIAENQLEYTIMD